MIERDINKRLKYTSGIQEDLTKMILNEDTPFSVVEAYKAVRTNLLYLPIENRCKKIVITSAVANEGKTVSAINIAITMAQIGKKVLLIDADMRASLLSNYLGIKEENGLSEYLVGIDQVPNIIDLKKQGFDFSILMKGNTPPNPAELLLSLKTESLLQIVERNYDYIIIDTPPVEVVTDATSLLKWVDGYIFIVRSEYSDIEILKEAVERLENLNGNIYGILMNEVSSSKSNYTLYKKNGYYNKRHTHSKRHKIVKLIEQARKYGKQKN